MKSYSGNASKPFWARVNALPEPSRSAAYQSGCLLQAMEDQVIRCLENYEHEAAEDKEDKRSRRILGGKKRKAR